ncbi:MAG: FAD-binding protein, partial [Nocardiopsaceae bacterium]|nr:FAD-binding protein [Nocardiopsaceae bacterium]
MTSHSAHPESQPSATPRGVWRNWAGTVTVRPARTRMPGSAAEVAAEVTKAASEGLPIKMAGSGHSFTPVASTEGVLLYPGGMNAVRSIDPSAGLVTVEAGCQLSALNSALHACGLSLTNMGDIQVQTVAGATQTGTHGTGRDSGSLAAQLAAVELVLADGNIVTCSAEEPQPDLFNACRVGLGALGIVTAV